jgi:hypothetical protein
MKTPHTAGKLFAAHAIAGMVFIGVVFEGIASETSATPRIKNYCDPVCELKTQDSAFTLLVEAYRMFQSRQIEEDYQMRLQKAAGLAPSTETVVLDADMKSVKILREWVKQLATKERDLRMEKLQVQVYNYGVAYNCVRKADEQRIGVKVPNPESPKIAQEELKRFKLIAVGGVASGRIMQVEAIPASVLFLDEPALPLPPNLLLDPCE